MPKFKSFTERMSEIQYQNRILLRKMLQIDLKASSLNPGKMAKQETVLKRPSNPHGLNAYNSLNRAVRIKDLAGIVDGNRRVLDRLQNVQSHYNAATHEQNFKK